MTIDTTNHLFHYVCKLYKNKFIMGPKHLLIRTIIWYPNDMYMFLDLSLPGSYLHRYIWLWCKDSRVIEFKCDFKTSLAPLLNLWSSFFIQTFFSVRNSASLCHHWWQFLPKTFGTLALVDLSLAQIIFS